MNIDELLDLAYSEHKAQKTKTTKSAKPTPNLVRYSPALGVYVPVKPIAAKLAGVQPPRHTQDLNPPAPTIKWKSPPSVPMSPHIPLRGGHPVEKLSVGKPLTNRRISHYQTLGRYGPEAKKAAQDRAKEIKLRQVKKAASSFDAILDALMR